MIVFSFPLRSSACYGKVSTMKHVFHVYSLKNISLKVSIPKIDLLAFLSLCECMWESSIFMYVLC